MHFHSEDPRLRASSLPGPSHHIIAAVIFYARDRSPAPDDTHGIVLTPISEFNRDVHMSKIGPGLRASSMLDVAAGILVLASVGIFLAHTLDAYRAQ